MAQTLDAPLVLDQELLDAPSTHPPVALPPGIIDPPVLGFAPAPTAPVLPPAVADRPVPVVRPQRHLTFGWYDYAIIVLILSSGALCLYRLMWAIQP